MPRAAPRQADPAGELGEAVTPDGVYKAVRAYAKAMGVESGRMRLGPLRRRMRSITNRQGAGVARACEYRNDQTL